MNKNIIIFLILFALINLILGKFDLFLGLFSLIVIFIPILYLSFKSNLLAIKTFTSTIFICLYFSFLFFYINFNEYDQFINFSFNDLDQLKIFIKIGLIMLCFVIFAIYFEKVISKPKIKNLKSINNFDKKNFFITSPKKNSIFITFIIIFFVAASIPLIDMMIKLGIGVTGARPTTLPFKLTGIMTHFFKTFLPFLLGILYLTNRRSLFLLLLLSIFAIYGGVHLASKTIVIGTLIIPLFFAFYDKRFFYVLFILIILSFGIEIATLCRPYLYLQIDNIIYVNKDFNFIETIQSQIKLVEMSSFARNIIIIFDRLLSFKLLYIASEIPISNIISGFDVWLHTLDWGFIVLPNDKLHYMSLGYTISFGFYNLSSDILTKILWSLDASFIYAILITATIAFLLVIIESIINRLKIKYDLLDRFANLTIIFFTISLMAHPGYPFLKYMLLIFILLNLFPKIKQLKELLAFLQVSKNDNNKK